VRVRGYDASLSRELKVHLHCGGMFSTTATSLTGSVLGEDNHDDNVCTDVNVANTSNCRLQLHSEHLISAEIGSKHGTMLVCAQCRTARSLHRPSMLPMSKAVTDSMPTVHCLASYRYDPHFVSAAIKRNQHLEPDAHRSKETLPVFSQQLWFVCCPSVRPSQQFRSRCRAAVHEHRYT
jgi:hypothetical protein